MRFKNLNFVRKLAGLDPVEPLPNFTFAFASGAAAAKVVEILPRRPKLGMDVVVDNGMEMLVCLNSTSGFWSSCFGGSGGGPGEGERIPAAWRVDARRRAWSSAKAEDANFASRLVVGVGAVSLVMEDGLSGKWTAVEEGEVLWEGIVGRSFVVKESGPTAGVGEGVVIGRFAKMRWGWCSWARSRVYAKRRRSGY